MDNKEARSRVSSVVALSAQLNELRQSLAAGGVKIEFIRHPESGNLGLRLPDNLVDVAFAVVEDNSEWEVDIFTEN